MGLQLIHMNNAVDDMMTLSEMIMTQMLIFIQRSEDIRSSVRAKEVLLHDAARTEKEPATLATSGIFLMASSEMSHRCFPLPKLTDTEVKADAIAKAT
jgi:hypothetical protein